MYYRTDVLNDPAIQKAYKDKYGADMPVRRRQAEGGLRRLGVEVRRLSEDVSTQPGPSPLAGRDIHS